MNLFKSMLLFGTIVGCLSCQNGHKAGLATDQYPDIFPDYKNITIPCNIAPLHFGVRDAQALYADISCQGKILCSVSGKDDICIDQDDWQNILATHPGDSLQIELSVFTEDQPQGIRYKPFSIHLSKDSIDPYLVYRLIEPGYESWQDMKICQRSLSDFTERVILKTDRNACINCHAFHNYSAKRMMLHYRKKGGGTLFAENGKLRKVDLKALPPSKQGVYPMWHPSGKYVIYSSNATVQSFYIMGKKPIEVYDSASDLILYEVEKNQITTDERLCNDSTLTTFPAWAPDGRHLYYCVSRPIKNNKEIRNLHYSLCRIGFNPETGMFTSPVDTLIQAETAQNSISFPRVSPDGRYLLYTESAYATFPIWHSESQLKLIDLTQEKPVDVSILNSDEADSYHSWSSNGKWIIFSSRRIDGRYTRLFIAHFDGKGHFSRPFLLPQSSTAHDQLRLESYNIPEFVDDPIQLSEKEVMELFN